MTTNLNIVPDHSKINNNSSLEYKKNINLIANSLKREMYKKQSKS